VKWIVGVLVAILALVALAFAKGGPGLLDVIDGWAPGAGGKRIATAQAFGAHGQTLDIWSDGAAKNKPVLVFFYGGGWVKGTRAEYGWAARAFASKGFVVVVPDYRKVPAVVYPAFLEDAADAVRWTHDNIARYGGDPARIAIAGHSAGGYAVAMLALDRRWLGKDANVIKAAVGLSGPYDFYPFTGRAVAAMGAWPKPLETQPITYARSDAPPMLLVTGDADTTVRPKNARNLFRKLHALGAPVALKEYAGLGHEDVAMALSLPFRRKAPVLEDASNFLLRTLKKPGSIDRP
jgi:acetyl esterase/lipase